MLYHFLRKHLKTILISEDIYTFLLICPVIVSTKQGLTKAETIQVKGNNHLCASHESKFGLFHHEDGDHSLVTFISTVTKNTVLLNVI